MTDQVTVVQYLNEQTRRSGKTHEEIAKECGWADPAVLRLILSGVSKLPINKLEPLANALGVEPAHLLKMALAEYLPDTWSAIQRVLLGGSRAAQRSQSQ